MSPQPLSSLRFAGCIEMVPFGVQLLAPESALLVLRYLAIWSATDALRERLAVLLMDADHRAACEFMAAITSGPARTAALKRSAKVVRSSEYELIEWVLDEQGPFDKQRHKFAHHVWLSVHERPDLVVLLDPSTLTSGIVTNIELATAPAPRGTRLGVEHWRNAYYYTQRELNRLLIDAENAYHRMSALETVLHPMKESDVARARLQEARRSLP